jgi:hypothetical protein
MIVDVKDHHPGTHAAGPQSDKPLAPRPRAEPADDSRIDQMSDGSFPASDPPSVWTWEVKTQAPTPGPPAER